ASSGDPRRAAQLYARASELAPDLPLPHDRRGALLKLAGEPIEAFAALRRAGTLRSPGHAPDLERLLGPRLDDSLANMLAKPKKLQVDPDVQHMLASVGTGNDIAIRIKEGKHAYDSEVLVISPTAVHWTGVVPQVLTQFGRVSDGGAQEFTDKGF